MKQRIELIDSLRGFSLLGILLANLLIFQYGLIGKDYLEDLSVVDSVSYYFTKIFIEASSMPIFTFLFGYSIIKLVESVKKHQAKSRWVIVRRAIGLMVIGGLHATFIWDGDILAFYGGITLILLFFLKRKPITLFIWAGVIFVAFVAMSYGPEVEFYDMTKMDAYLAKEQQVLSSGTYAEILEYRQQGELPVSDDQIGVLVAMIFLAPILNLPLFFVGMAFAKLHIFANPSKEHKLYKWLSLLIIVGVAMKVASLTESNFSGMLAVAGGPILSLGYIGAFALFYQLSIDAKWKTAFSAAGKLSLTNYLLQSVICTTIFYGYGLGLFGSLGVTLALLMGIAIYGCQLIFSQLYLKKFSRGPVEVLLRLWTNLSWRPKQAPYETIQPRVR